MEDGGKSAGLGWTFTNREGSLRINASQIEEYVSSPLQAEVLAARAALMDAHDHGWQYLCLKSDSKELIQAIKTEEHSKEIYGIVKDINQLSTLFSFISFSFVSRSDNVLTDDLAKVALISILDVLRY